jgi:hypothetical protein
MFRAFILSLLGGTFEVRLINTQSGKDIPGTRLFKGGYWKARKVLFNKNLKAGQVIRLQAVTVLNWDYQTPDQEEAMVEIPPDMIVVDEASQISQEAWDAGKAPESSIPKGVITHNIGEANQRQSDFMHEHQDEPNEYRGEDVDDHVCDDEGPQDWDTDSDTYRPTCSVCESFSKNV